MEQYGSPPVRWTVARRRPRASAHRHDVGADGFTRLPGDARLAADDAARLLDTRFAMPLVLSAARARTVHATLSRIGIAGGAGL